MLLFVATLARWLASTERELPLRGPLPTLLVLFGVHAVLSTRQALAPELAVEKRDALLKILAALFLTTALIDRPERLRLLVRVVTLSIAF